MTDGSRSLELAHVMPGRIRLRWHGEGMPPEGLLTRLRGADEIQEVEYKASSRSLVLLHRNGFGVEELRSIADAFDLEVREPPPPPTLNREKREPLQPAKKWEIVLADLEALLLVGLMVSWIRDLVSGRRVRPGTLLLLILTGMNLFQYWQRRQERASEPESPEEPELELLTA
jgi:hypothetical protein